MSAASNGRPKLTALLPAVLLLGLGLSWGLGFALAKIAINHGVPPFGYVFWQTAGGGTLLLVVSSLMGQRPKAAPNFLRYYLLIGVLALALPNAIGYTVLSNIPVSVWSLTINFAPIFTYIVAVIAGLERVQTIRLSGIALGLAGVLLLILPDTSLPDRSMVGWVLLGIATPFLYGISNVAMVTMRPVGATSMGLASGMTLAAGAALLPVVLATGSLYVPNPAALTIGDAALACQLLITAGGYVVFHEIQRLAGPVFAGFVGFIVTLSGISWGVVLLGEQPGGWLFLALILILGGMALVNLGGRLIRRKPAAADD
ncbi:MAG: DMT family transporter [Pseudomonadota bacterium]